MPTIGPFHGKFWRTRANPVVPAGPSANWMYPKVQSVVIMGLTLLPIDRLLVLWERLTWLWPFVVRLWRWPEDRRDLLTTALDRCAPAFDQERRYLEQQHQTPLRVRVVLERVRAVMEGPYWTEAGERVRACATTPKFHQPEQWVEWGRAIKTDKGQAQNLFRHLRVVLDLKAAHPTMSNPEAHLMTELAYQEFAAQGRADRRIEPHPVLQ